MCIFVEHACFVFVTNSMRSSVHLAHVRIIKFGNNFGRVFWRIGKYFTVCVGQISCDILVSQSKPNTSVREVLI